MEKIEEGPTDQFWAYDNTEPDGNHPLNNYYRITASQKAVGTYCEVWVDLNVDVSEEKAKTIAAEFDGKIYKKIRDTFGDYMAYDADVDGNNRLTLLLLDIKDANYYDSSSSSYVAGYFYWPDLFNGDSFSSDRSNERDMIYMDVNPGLKDMGSFYSTIAHEFQHLINFVIGLENRAEEDEDELRLNQTDIWIDEGLSTAAEYVYLGRHDTSSGSRIDYFNRDKAETISKGNNFFVWNNLPKSVLDDYSTAYLFFQWLRIQSGGTRIYKDIINSGFYDFNAVTDAAGSIASTWESLLGAWLQANYRNDPTGIYGYRGEIATRVWAISGGPKVLNPGEAVYTKASNAGSDRGTIRFKSISKSGTTPGLDNDYYGNRVLMYNVNSDKDAGSASGTLPAGNGESRPAASVTGGRSVLSSEKPYPVGIWDVRRRQSRDFNGTINIKNNVHGKF
jgi:hypothetical protein